MASSEWIFGGASFNTILIRTDALRERNAASRRPRMALRAEARWGSCYRPQVWPQRATLVAQSEILHPLLSGHSKGIAELSSDRVLDGEIVAR